ncbi:hypothetical protein OIU84_022521 [Salix udensis]|uniref:Uncharacterized protein n=1 Tax=Salix udensis TaxID=889485 RepID=A0AAD6KNS7_9ROSI|nr:hypothetical protein OIU84_022521 [Salix udensis]
MASFFLHETMFVIYRWKKEKSLLLADKIAQAWHVVVASFASTLRLKAPSYPSLFIQHVSHGHLSALVEKEDIDGDSHIASQAEFYFNFVPISGHGHPLMLCSDLDMDYHRLIPSVNYATHRHRLTFSPKTGDPGDGSIYKKAWMPYGSLYLQSIFLPVRENDDPDGEFYCAGCEKETGYTLLVTAEWLFAARIKFVTTEVLPFRDSCKK